MSDPILERPLASILLIAYKQQGTVAAAIEGALAQTYQPLEILVSDDASDDGTFEAMAAAVARYAGPHTVRLRRNAANLGIGAHLSQLVAEARGEMLFVAAGDDISLPERCERVMQAWLDHGKRPDLIATALVDVDGQGRDHGFIRPSDLATYRSLDDWLARPPFVVGAAQAWTARVFARFGPLAPGVVGEDLIMVFRAIASGGALTLDEPLVRYRRGGISRRVRNLHAEDVVRRLLASNRSALVELPQLLRDARRIGGHAAVEVALQKRLQREQFVRDLFAAPSTATKLAALTAADGVPWDTRLRLGLYALWPGALRPFFSLKRLLDARQRRRD